MASNASAGRPRFRSNSPRSIPPNSVSFPFTRPTPSVESADLYGEARLSIGGQSELPPIELPCLQVHESKEEVDFDLSCCSQRGVQGKFAVFAPPRTKKIARYCHIAPFTQNPGFDPTASLYSSLRRSSLNPALTMVCRAARSCPPRILESSQPEEIIRLRIHLVGPNRGRRRDRD